MFSYFAQNFLLPALAAVVAAVISLILGGTKWSFRKHIAITLPLVIAAFAICWFVARSAEPAEEVVLAGMVVNESNEPLAQATITLADGSTHYLSEDNGNYRLDLTGKVRRSERVRIHVAKSGYSPVDASVEVPAEGYIVQLHRL